MLVSVVIPVFNIEAHLRECLESVVRQELTDIEIICVDDGSTDGTSGILAEYAARDARIHIITQENAGPGVARNAGLLHAAGKYVIFLDSDDWFEPDFLHCMVQNAEETGADVVICQAVEFDTNTRNDFPSEWMLKKEYIPNFVFRPLEIARYMFQFTYGMAWDKIYLRSRLMEQQLWFPPLRNSEDLAFVYPSLITAQKISILPKVFIHHRVHRRCSVSNTRERQPDAPYQAFEIVERFLTAHEWMDAYRQSFMNWAMEFLVWHVCNMEDRSIQKEYLHLFRHVWRPRLNFEAYPVRYYRSGTLYLKYLLARYAPYPIFRFMLNSYKTVKNSFIACHGGK